MLLNLTNRYIVKANNNEYGGIDYSSIAGPKFGIQELMIDGPFLGDNKVKSQIGSKGFMIPGKAGAINPLTGDIIIGP
jgi:hypothetical protein